MQAAVQARKGRDAKVEIMDLGRRGSWDSGGLVTMLADAPWKADNIRGGGVTDSSQVLKAGRAVTGRCMHGIGEDQRQRRP
jgi:hypothetical protein